MFEINFIRNKIKNLDERTKILEKILKYNTIKERVIELNCELENPKIWNNSQLIKNINQESFRLKRTINSIKEIKKNIKEIIHFLHLNVIKSNKNILYDIKKELQITEKKINMLEFYRMFSKKHDHLNCYIDLQAGSGGTEAQDWAKMLLRMYLKWSNEKGFKTNIIEESEGDIAGIKSATIKISGEYAFGWLRTENGIHRLVRKSPFNANNRRHTSFCSAFIYPDIDHTVCVNINTVDLRIDVYRASGAGGQHVNRTESAVRITHLPTGVTTQCQNDRSQHKNKEQAMKQMQAKLYQLEIQKKKIEKKELNGNKSDIGWGQQIRSYILDDSRIKDIRTGIETRDVQSVLNGKLDQFITTNLKLGF
ncbi:peptide chain release factor 2 [Buchnera aphidicola (Pemphigus obesinymphae)]|uniref:peptide chain release factor 2 n=1 Tax=Buchnera aphidicola TaxID=9 RepID=UPI0022370B71|nr:peptide chain release factor 2 [Buchnera aphidicola]MCW5196349.1 peptide chain release factor 2 [Buchnera aphidicola (Pemphigus obesinymphae)]